MTIPIICISCGFSIGFIIHKYKIKSGENINFDKIEQELNIKLRTCCRMKMLTFIQDY